MKFFLQRFFRPESALEFFIFFGFLFSFLFLILTPPFQSPDSFQHFYRTYQIAEGQWTGIKVGEVAGGYLPFGLKEEVEKLKHLPFQEFSRTSFSEVLQLLKNSRPLSFYENQSKGMTSFPNTVLYPPLAYLPQVTAFLISQKLDLTLYQTYYFVCFLKFIFCFFIFYLAIRFALISIQWPLVFFLLLPMNIFLLPTLSPDSFIIALGFLLFSLALHPIWNKNNFLFPLYTFIGMVLSFSKIIYFLIPFVLFLKKNSKKSFINLKHFLILLCVCLPPSILWSLHAKKIFVPLLKESALKDPNLQFQKIMESPIFFVEVLQNTLYKNGFIILNSLIGTLGWMDVFLPKGIYLFGILFLILILLFSTSSPHHPNFSLKARLGAGFIVFGTFLMMFISLFLTATTIENNIVHGLQGRYFLVLLPFLLILCPPLKILAPFSRSTPWIVRIAACILLIFSLFAVIDRFYLS